MSSFNPSESTPSQQGCTDQSSVGSGSTDNLLRDQRGSQLGYSLALHSAAEGTPHPRSLARGGGDLSVYDPALIPDMPGLEPSRTPDFRGSVQPPADAQHESLTPFDGDSGFDDWVNWTGEQNEVQYQTGTPFNIADLALNQTTPGFYTDDFDDAAAAAINSIEPSGQPYATPDLQQHAFSPNARQVAQRNTPVSPTAFVAPPQRAPRRSMPGIQVNCYVPRLPNQQVAQGQRQHAHVQNNTADEIRPDVQVVVQVFGNQMN